jgi:glyoxylase-like metal-dependent hydrolase (beta-lactamase superfamily II)
LVFEMTPTAQERAPGVFEIPSVIGGTIRIAQWLIVGSEGALLIDTGIASTPQETIFPALTQLEFDIADVTHLLLSHCDVDHCGGTSGILERAPEAKVLAPGAERAQIESWPVLRDQRYRWVQPYGLEVAVETETWLEQEFGGPITVTQDVADGDLISLGSVSAQIVALPGHSPDLVGVWLEEQRTLIAMDAVFGRGPDPAEPTRVNPPQYGSVELYGATIERVASLDPLLLGSSHFDPLSGDAIAPFLAESSSFVASLDELLAGALTSEPATLSALTDTANSALGPFRPDFNELARSVHAHLERFVAAGTAVHASDGHTTTWRAA